MKTLTITLLALVLVASPKQFELTANRQRSNDPDYNGIMFRVQLDDRAIKEGEVSFFLTRADLKQAWEKELSIR